MGRAFANDTEINVNDLEQPLTMHSVSK